MLGGFIEGFSAINGAKDILNGLLSVKSLSEQTEVRLKVISLVDTLESVQQELKRKDKIIEELREQLDVKQKVSYKEGSPFVWIKNEDGSDIAYCPKCYVKDKNLSRIMEDRPMKNLGTHQCSVCDSWFGKKIDPFENGFNSVFGKR